MAAWIPGQSVKALECVLLVCDVQERFRDVIQGFTAMLAVIERLIKGARTLQIPILVLVCCHRPISISTPFEWCLFDFHWWWGLVQVTEQYPKGLGSTVSELGLSECDDVGVYEKSVFSMLTPPVRERLAELGRRTLILVGIESHVCVQQTALDALAAGYQVILPADATSSRSPTDRHFALEVTLPSDFLSVLFFRVNRPPHSFQTMRDELGIVVLGFSRGSECYSCRDCEPRVWW